MGNITLSIPDDMHRKMRDFPEVRWSQVARRAIGEKLDSLQLAERLAEKSKLTSKDIEEFSRKVKRSAAKRFFG
jgi:hypothetical protein